MLTGPLSLSCLDFDPNAATGSACDLAHITTPESASVYSSVKCGGLAHVACPPRACGDLTDPEGVGGGGGRRKNLAGDRRSHGEPKKTIFIEFEDSTWRNNQIN